MSIITYNLPALVVALPLLMAAVIALIPSRRVAWVLTLMTVISVTFAAYGNALMTIGASVSYELGGWPPPWGIEFITDGASRVMAIIIASLSLVSTLYAKPLIEKEIHLDDIPRTYAAWLLTIGGMMGLVMTADAFNLFVFLEISSLSAVTLVAMGAGVDRRALMAAFNYLIIGAIGATFYVIGVGFCYAVTGTLNMADLATRLPEATSAPVVVGLAFMATGMMVKAAAFPVHMWLPAAYSYAPSAVSSLLSAVATKAAIYVLARILFTVFGGLEDVTGLIMTWVLIPLSILAMFAGTILAIFEHDLKKMLAQSSIAQIGYITLALGIGTTATVTAGFIHMVNHAMIKGGLFMAVGALAVTLGRRANLASITGLGRAMPITTSALLVCGFSLIGLPLTAGFISKIYLISALLDEGQGVITALVLLSSALSVVYLWKMIEVMWMRPAPEGTKIQENPWMYGPVWVLAVANIIFGVYATPVVALARDAAMALMGGGA
ncbi:MAG: monovalent cation/H+ antiporter subunit D family protein [Alphaproteobacteria bacterium]|nr:monovalent cation/H+ antiporter subunit D family protein [Alphaproteobacteria bacterium]